MYVFPSTHSPQAYSTLWVSSNQWHTRFGYPSMYIVSHIFSKALLLVMKSSKECIYHFYCQSKHHQLPYTRHSFTITAPLQLLFIDIWSPTPIISHGSFCYYLLFVDDYSRFTWVFPLKCKLDITSIFLSFKCRKLFKYKNLFVAIWLGWRILITQSCFIVFWYFPSLVLPLCTPTKWHSWAKTLPYSWNRTRTPYFSTPHLYWSDAFVTTNF